MTANRCLLACGRRAAGCTPFFQAIQIGTSSAFVIVVSQTSARRSQMAFVVTEPCVGCKYTDCVVVCPMECFYGDDQMLYIDPDDCIDCGACLPECPAEALFQDVNVPTNWKHYIQLNADRVRLLKPAGARVTEKLQQ
jgi:ferredoxin